MRNEDWRTFGLNQELCGYHATQATQTQRAIRKKRFEIGEGLAELKAIREEMSRCRVCL